MAGSMPQNVFAPEVSTEVSVQRATKLLQEAFLIFREGLYDQDTTFNLLDQGNVVLTNDIRRPARDAAMAADHVPIYDLPHATPYELNQYPEQIKRTLLMIFQCMDSTIVMAPMINSILGPYCSRVEEVHFQPKNEALWARWENEEDAPRVTHYILRATLEGSGAQYAIDITSPQYNWHDDPPMQPWAWYAANRVKSYCYILDGSHDGLSATFNNYIGDWLCDFTDTGAPVFFDDPRRTNIKPGLFAHGRWMLRRDFADGIAAFETTSLPLAHIVALPQAQFTHYADAFLHHLRIWVDSVPARWRAIKNLYGVTGPVAARIRQQRIVEQRQPFGQWVSPTTGVRVTENEAYTLFMSLHKGHGLDAHWGPIQPPLSTPQPAHQGGFPPAHAPTPAPASAAVAPGLTLPPIRRPSTPNHILAANPAHDLNIAGVTAQRPAVVIDQDTDINRLFADAGLPPLGQISQADIDQMMAQMLAQTEAEQRLWTQHFDLNAYLNG